MIWSLKCVYFMIKLLKRIHFQIFNECWLQTQQNLCYTITWVNLITVVEIGSSYFLNCVFFFSFAQIKLHILTLKIQCFRFIQLLHIFHCVVVLNRVWMKIRLDRWEITYWWVYRFYSRSFVQCFTWRLNTQCELDGFQPLTLLLLHRSL